MIAIDGSHLEGGGQILRTSLALSILTGTPFTITEIRKNRPQPGLRPQHLAAVRAAQALSGARVEGDAPGSKSLIFKPGGLTSEDLALEVGTAGSVTLILQALLLPALFADHPLTLLLGGGTDVAWSPPFDYFANVLVPFLSPFGKIEASLLKRGYYPRGGGKIRVRVTQRFRRSDFGGFPALFRHLSSALPPLELTTRRDILWIEGVSHAEERLASVPRRQAEGAEAHLRNLGCPVRIRTESAPSPGPGSGIWLRAVFKGEDRPRILGGGALGKRGKPAEAVGREAAEDLLSEIRSGAPVDRHLADQILPFAALSPSAAYTPSVVTPHTLANAHVVSRFLDVTPEIADGRIRITRTGGT